MRQTDLAKRLGVTASSVVRWEDGTFQPSALALLAISRFAPPSEKDYWIKQSGLQPAAADQAPSGGQLHLAMVPLLKDSAAAGTPRAIDETEVDQMLPLPKEWLRGGKIIAVKVDGDSMAPIILAGHIVFIDVMDRDPKRLVEKMVAAREGHGVTIKWLRKDAGDYLLVPQHTSKKHPVRILRESGDFAIVGRVVKWIGEPPK